MYWPKGQRSRLHGYENRHGRMADSEVCCSGRFATGAGVGLHVVWLLKFLVYNDDDDDDDDGDGALQLGRLVDLVGRDRLDQLDHQVRQARPVLRVLLVSMAGLEVLVHKELPDNEVCAQQCL